MSREDTRQTQPQTNTLINAKHPVSKEWVRVGTYKSEYSVTAVTNALVRLNIEFRVFREGEEAQ